jgi:hypothetical protein
MEKENSYEEQFGNANIEEIKNESKQEEIIELENVNEKVEEVLSKNENNEDIEKLKSQIEKLTKQKNDSENWGRKQRAAYSLAKKRTEELSKKLFDEGTIFEEEYNTLQGIFEHSFNTDDLPNETKQDDNPFKPVIDRLQNTFDEYRKWSDEKDLGLKYNSFFKHLELITPKKLQDIQEYLVSEQDPKEALKYVLSNGEKYYNKFYKHAVEKGDGFSYIEEILNKNEILEKKIKDLTSELEETTGKVYTKSMKSNNGFQNSPNKRGAYEEQFGL